MTHQQLFDLRRDADIMNILAIEVAVQAANILLLPGTSDRVAQRRVWARNVLSSGDGPEREAERAVWLFLAQNKDMSLAQLRAAGADKISAAVASVIELTLPLA